MELSEMEDESQQPKFLILMNKQLFLGVIFIKDSLPFDVVDIRDNEHPLYNIVKSVVKEIDNLSNEKIPDFSFEENQAQNLFSRKLLEEMISTNSN